MTTATGASKAARTAALTNGQVMSLAGLMFLLPNLLFTANLAAPAAWVVIAGVVVALGMILGRERLHPSALLRAPANLLDLLLCVMLGAGLVLLGGEGHLVYANADWFWRDAVLADLVHAHGLPQYDINGTLWLLRAPLGLYLAPALVGKAWGLGAAHAAMAAQNGVLTGLILFGFTLLMPRRRASRLLVLIAFSGLDILGTLMIHRLGPSLNPIDLPSHLGWWNLWQYSSQMTQIFWVPNHALPGWWLALLILLCAQGEISLGYLGLSLATALFWSPLAAIGAAPFAVALFMKKPLGNLRDRWLWAHFLASLLFLPLAIYLLAGAEQIPHKLMPQEGIWFSRYFLFECMELALPLCILLNWRNNPLALNLPAVVAVIVLVALPWFIFGPADDLAMRGSIPGLTILAFLASGLIADGRGASAIIRITAAVLAVLGAVTGGFELARVLIFPSFAISDCDFMSVQFAMDPTAMPYHYLLRQGTGPVWLARNPSSVSTFRPGPRLCWPDYPFDPRLMVGDHSTRELLAAKRNAHR